MVWTSVVRTFAPQIAGLIVGLFASIGLEVDNTVVLAAVTQVFALVYYVVVRYLEEFKDSKYGKLLGSANAPLYLDANDWPAPSVED